MYIYYNISVDVKSGYRTEYNQEKSLVLKSTRGIDFEDVIKAIDKNQILDDIDHFNKKRYPNQRILVIEINNYVYAIPYIIDKKRKVVFLKTIYPNRKLTKKYLKKII